MHPPSLRGTTGTGRATLQRCRGAHKARPLATEAAVGFDSWMAVATGVPVPRRVRFLAYVRALASRVGWPSLVPGLVAFSVLAGAGIPIEMVTTSQVRITCLVPESLIEEAVRLLHHAFRLDDGLPVATRLPGSLARAEDGMREVVSWSG